MYYSDDDDSNVSWLLVCCQRLYCLLPLLGQHTPNFFLSHSYRKTRPSTNLSIHQLMHLLKHHHVHHKYQLYNSQSMQMVNTWATHRTTWKPTDMEIHVSSSQQLHWYLPKAALQVYWLTLVITMLILLTLTTEHVHTHLSMNTTISWIYICEHQQFFSYWTNKPSNDDITLLKTIN
jgi:hypothetical protein